MLIGKSDITYTLRQLGKKPGFIILAVLVLAGGLGVSLMAFTISYSMTYKSLPVTNGDRIIHICTRPKVADCGEMIAHEFAAMRDDITTLENIGIYTTSRTPVEIAGQIRNQLVVFSEWNLFRLSDTQALLGRALQPSDHAAGADPVAVISHDFWQTRFDSTTDIIGTLMKVGGISTRIVGVMPPGYNMPWNDHVWLPIGNGLIDPAQPGFDLVYTYARIKPGETMASASAEIDSLMSRIRQLYPYAIGTTFSTNAAIQADISRRLQNEDGHVATFMVAEFGAVGAIVLAVLINLLSGLIFTLACINVGTLLLARTNERLKDLSIRVALGAPRKRLLLQSMGEAIVITLAGSILALLIAGISLDFINLAYNSLDGQILAFWMQFRIDLSTLYGVFIFIVLTILLTSGIPSWRLINGNFNTVMNDGTRGSLGLKPGRFSRSLVVVSIVLISVLLYLATLAGSAVIPALNGIKDIPDNAIAAYVTLPSERYSHAQKLQFYRILNDSLINDPAIRHVTFNSGTMDVIVETEAGAASGDDNERVETTVTGRATVNPFPEDSTFLFPDEPVIIEGRSLNDFDGTDSELVITINRALASRLWPGESALGKRLRIHGNDYFSADWRRVVGIQGDTANANFITGRSDSAMTAPLSQLASRTLPVRLMVYTGNPNSIQTAITATNRTIEAMDSSLRFQVNDIATLGERLARSINMGINLALACGVFALLVALAGIFGLTQNTVLMATREIGIRRALGASDANIRLTFMLRGCRQLLKAFLLALLFSSPISVLYLGAIAGQLDINVPASYGWVVMVIALLYGTVLLAILQPVRKVLGGEPADGLRYE